MNSYSPPQNPRRRQLLQFAALGSLAGACPPLLAQAARKPLLIVSSWEISGLSPSASGYIFTRLQVAETLFNALDDGTPQPGLATRWEVSADGLVWQITLRPGARFHDGSPVTAQAAARCLDAARTPPALLSKAPIAGIKAVGDKQLEIRLSRPDATLPSLLAHSSTLILAPASFGPDGAVRQIIGSGPYRITQLQAPQQVDTAIFTDFDGPRPQIEQVRYMPAGRAEARTLMAESGQADLAYNLDPPSVARLRSRPGVRLDAVTLPRTVIINLNAGLPALRDVRVRQALSCALDRPGIARALLRDPELAATQLMPPSLTAWHDKTLSPLHQDKAEVTRLMQAAGWSKSPEGWRNAKGDLLRLSLRTFPDRPELPVLAAALQAQWREAGFAVEVKIGNSGDIPLAQRDGTLELGLCARNYATVPDPVGTLLQDFANGGGDWGAMNWPHPEVSAALTALTRDKLTPARAAELRRQVLRTLHDELPVIPVCWYRQQVAVSRRIDGVSLDPLERSFRLTGLRWKA